MKPLEKYIKLNNSQSEPEIIVRKFLAYFEFDLKSSALMALLDLEKAGFSSKRFHEFFIEIRTPSFGLWNRLFGILQKIREDILYKGSKEERERLSQTLVFIEKLDAYFQALSNEETESMLPLAKFANVKKVSEFKDLASIAVIIRNHISHNYYPDNDPIYFNIAQAIKNFIQILSNNNFLKGIRQESTDNCGWFVEKNSEIYVFNGISEGKVIYNSLTGAAEINSNSIDIIIRKISTMMGSETLSDKNIASVISKTAPEEIKGVVMGDYLVRSKIGEGGFARVYSGYKLSTGRKVALKVIKEGLDDESISRFKQEAVLLGKINNEYVIEIIDFCEDTPWLETIYEDVKNSEWFREFSKVKSKDFIVTEWIEGRTLEFCLNQKEDLSIADITKWFYESAHALEAVHSIKIIHRDIKPSNIMIRDNSNKAVLMDFGIARKTDHFGTKLTAIGSIVGTPAYMSPEQIRYEEAESFLGPATDIYSLCASFYEIYSGKRLYSHDTETPETVRNLKLEGKKPERPTIYKSELPYEIEVILMGGLESEVKDRYQDAKTLSNDIDSYINNRPISYKRPGYLRRAVLWYLRNQKVANIIVIFSILIFLTNSFYIYNLDIQRIEAVKQKNIAQKMEKLKEEALIKANNALADSYYERALMLESSGMYHQAMYYYAASEKLKQTEDARDRYYYSLLRNRIKFKSVIETSNEVNCLSISNDAKKIALGDKNGNIKIMMSDGNTESGIFARMNGAILDIKFGPDDKMLSASSASGEVRIYDIASQSKIIELEKNTAEVRCAAFSEDLKFIAIVYKGNNLKIYNSASSAVEKEIHIDINAEIGTFTTINNINRIYISSELNKVFCFTLASPDCSIVDISSGAVVKIKMHDTSISDFKVTNINEAFSCGADYNIKKWNIRESVKNLISYTLKTKYFRIAVSCGGKYLAAYLNDSPAVSKIDIYETENLKAINSLPLKNMNVSDIKWFPGTDILAVTCRNKKIFLYEIKNDEDYQIIDKTDRIMGFSQDSKALYYIDPLKNIVRHNILDIKKEEQLILKTSQYKHVSYFESDETIFYSDGKLINIHDIKKMETETIEIPGTINVLNITFSPVTKICAVCVEDGFMLYRPEVKKFEGPFALPKFEHKTLNFSPNGKTIHFSGKKEVALVSAYSGDVLFRNKISWIFDQSFFSPDGKYFTYSSNKFKDYMLVNTEKNTDRVLIKLNDNSPNACFIPGTNDFLILEKGKMIIYEHPNYNKSSFYQFENESLEISSPLFSNNMNFMTSIITKDGVRRIALIDFKKKKTVGKLIFSDSHEGNSFGIKFSPDGKYIAAKTSNGKIFIWRLYPEYFNMTPEEKILHVEHITGLKFNE